MISSIKRLYAQHIAADMPPRIRLRTAYHEAGHAYFMASSPLWKNISIRMTSSGGLAKSEYGRRSDFSDAEAGWLIMRMTLAGAVVEQYFFNGYSKYGSWRDINCALELAGGREQALLDYIEGNYIPYRVGMIEPMVPSSTSLVSKQIMAAAVHSSMSLVNQDCEKIRALGKELYKNSFLHDSEIRRILENDSSHLESCQSRRGSVALPVCAGT